MSVLKIKKNGVWESVSGTSGHTHTVSDITDFPEDFTTSGGDADTVDGKHASDFATSEHTHEQIDVLTSLVGDTDVSTQIANAIVDKADSNHAHDEATTSTSGFMSATDKEKLDGIENGANYVLVDHDFFLASTNPVRSERIQREFDYVREQIGRKADKVHEHDIDSELSETSSNPISNKAVYNAISGKADLEHTHTQFETLYGPHNKPSGSYTGTNADRTIQIGGNGKILLTTFTETTVGGYAIVTDMGAFITKISGSGITSWFSADVIFKNGTLHLVEYMTSGGELNNTFYDHYYQVL